MMLDDGRIVAYERDRQAGNVPCERVALPASEQRIVIIGNGDVNWKIHPIDDEL